MRRSGSAALDLAYVAAGRVDFFVELGLKPWDIAAGELLVKEAAGAVVDLQGGYDTLQTGCVLACHASLTKPVLTLLMPSWGKVYKNVLAP
jgi:myo-inositol-1(or 4)-monophosphatase